ncbi:MAG: thiamine phosphate synthase [Clostridia bacterium]|nr:thiamine phosphate synthase [Clostridia bacterium]
MKSEDLLLYAVTDRSWHSCESLYEQVEKAIDGGATFVQLREKKLGFDEFLDEAREICSLCRSKNVPFVINDNVEIARLSGADGVHLGQGDMNPAKARKILGADKIIGVSARTAEQALEAEKAGADYLGSGAVFSTSTKADAKNLSYEALKEICSAVKIPVIAIGGVSEKNILSLAGSGICGVAVVSAIFGAKDIKAAAASLRMLSEKTVKGCLPDGL